jgi:hypothetical protein
MRVRVIVFNTLFNNISVISWWSVLLVEETAIPHGGMELTSLVVIYISDYIIDINVTIIRSLP